jgi:hypothetical protein
VRGDEKEFRHEGRDRREGGRKFGEGAVKFKNSKDRQVNGTENFRFSCWAAGIFGDGYVDRWEGTESWVEEGEEMKVMMGAGGGGESEGGKTGPNETEQKRGGM